MVRWKAPAGGQNGRSTALAAWRYSPGQDGAHTRRARAGHWHWHWQLVGWVHILYRRHNREPSHLTPSAESRSLPPIELFLPFFVFSCPFLSISPLLHRYLYHPKTAAPEPEPQPPPAAEAAAAAEKEARFRLTKVARSHVLYLLYVCSEAFVPTHSTYLTYP